MAWGLKYFGEFNEPGGELVRVEISSLDYSGPTKELDFAEDPVVIERPNRELFEPILSTICNLRIWSNVNFEYEDLFLSAPRDNMVVVKRENAVIFRGYVEPGLYEEEFIAPPYIISLKATDGLKSLENYKSAYFGLFMKSNLYDIMKRCLSEAFDLPINICCSIFSRDHDSTAGKTLFEQSLIDHEGLVENKDGVVAILSALEILTNILNGFGCRIYQANDEWFIERIRDRARGANTFVRVDTLGVSSIVTHLASAALGSDSEGWYSEPSLQVDTGCASLTVKQEMAEPLSLIRNNFSGGLTYKVPDYADRVDREKWFYTNEYCHMEPFSGLYGISRGISMHHTIVGKLQTLYQIADCTAYGGDTVNIKFKIAVSAAAGLEKIKARFAVYINSFNFINVDGEVLRTGDVADHIVVKELDYWKDFNGDLTQAAEVTLESKKLPAIAGTPQTNTIKIILLPALEGVTGTIDYTHIGDLEVSVNTTKKPLNTFSAKSSKGFWKTADDVTLQINDAPESSLNFVNNGVPVVYDNYRNVTNILVFEQTVDLGGGTDTYKVFKPLTGWYDSASELPADGKQLAELLLQDRFCQVIDSRATIGGDVITDKPLSPLYLFSIDYRPGLYMFLGDKWDLLSGTHSLTVTQVYDQIIPID
jgi:hypothetical protein